MQSFTPIARISAGIALTFAGLAMLVLPGPGLLTLVAAANLLARDLPFAARLVAPVNTRLRQLRTAMA